SGAIKIAGVTIGDAICWDIAFDGLARENIRHGAQVLVVQTSNATFTGTAQPEQQWRISRLRAVETGRYVLIPSTNGITGVVDANGRTAARAKTETATVVSAKITLGNGTTPGVRYGGILETLMVTLGLVGLIVSRRRAKGPE
ncbi:MAG: nitrilase-related carbon-nitrogen hydrolase, partial [Aeromicrobium sp.]